MFELLMSIYYNSQYVSDKQNDDNGLVSVRLESNTKIFLY